MESGLLFVKHARDQCKHLYLPKIKEDATPVSNVCMQYMIYWTSRVSQILVEVFIYHLDKTQRIQERHLKAFYFLIVYTCERKINRHKLKRRKFYMFYSFVIALYSSRKCYTCVSYNTKDIQAWLLYFWYSNFLIIISYSLVGNKNDQYNTS